jgi:hypothetical protein
MGHAETGAVVVHLVTRGGRGERAIGAAHMVGSRGFVTKVTGNGFTRLSHVQGGATDGSKLGSDSGTEIGLGSTGGLGFVLTGTFVVIGTLASRITREVLVTVIAFNGASSANGTSTAGSLGVVTDLIRGAVCREGDALDRGGPGTISGTVHILGLGVVTDVTPDLAGSLESRVGAALGDVVTGRGGTEVGDLSALGGRGPDTGADNTRRTGGTRRGSSVNSVTSFARKSASVSELGRNTRSGTVLISHDGAVSGKEVALNSRGQALVSSAGMRETVNVHVTVVTEAGGTRFGHVKRIAGSAIGMRVSSAPVSDGFASDGRRPLTMTVITSDGNTRARGGRGGVAGLAGLDTSRANSAVCTLGGGEASRLGSATEVSVSNTLGGCIPGAIGLAGGRSGQVIAHLASGSASFTNGPVVGATRGKVVAGNQGTVVNDQVADGHGAPDTLDLRGGSNTFAERTGRGFITSIASGVVLSVDGRGGEALTVGDVQHGAELVDEGALGSGLKGLVGHAGHGFHVQRVTKVAVEVAALGGHVTRATTNTIAEGHSRAPVLLGSTLGSGGP